MRNNYEAKIGRFRNAITLNLPTFRQLPELIKQLEPLKEKNIVTYCTGGVRCEKAVSLLKKHGFKFVKQLHGGILNYGKECSDAYWEGKCFVFDTRGAVNIDPEKQSEPITQCEMCRLPCDAYHNCRITSCDRRFIACEACIKILNGCCSKNCRHHADPLML